MKEATGYLSEDGKFFESQEEAEEYEAWISLKNAIDEVGVTDIVVVIATIPNEIRRYINANEAASKYRSLQANDSAKDEARRKRPAAFVLEQQANCDEPLSDMGSGIIKEEVRLERKIDGVGNRRIDASDVCGSEDLAVGTHTEPTETCPVYSPPNIRKGSME